MKPDERSFRIMLAADRYVNPPPDGVDAVAVAEQTGWGVMQLPADDYPPEVAGPLLAEVAEQLEEFSRQVDPATLTARLTPTAVLVARRPTPRRCGAAAPA